MTATQAVPGPPTEVGDNGPDTSEWTNQQQPETVALVSIPEAIAKLEPFGDFSEHHLMMAVLHGSLGEVVQDGARYITAESLDRCIALALAQQTDADRVRLQMRREHNSYFQSPEFRRSLRRRAR